MNSKRISTRIRHSRLATSTLLAEFRAAAGGERVTLGEIAKATHGRANGILLVILALPETIPLIGFSLILALPIFIIGSSILLAGRESPLPKWLLRTRIRRSIVHRAIDVSLPRLRRLESVLRPRWPLLAGADRFLGATTCLMAVVLAAPLPGPNILAALAVALTGVGLLQRDGAVVAAALGLATAALGVTILLVAGGAVVFTELVPGLDVTDG